MLLTEFNTRNYSPSCDRNKDVISAQLGALFQTTTTLLEVGSLSGQHGAHVSAEHPHLHWQPSDLMENLTALNANVKLANLNNLAQPIPLDVAKSELWPKQQYNVIFTANTLHIMSWLHVQKLFENMSISLSEQATLCVYGPFKYRGNYTSASNAEFQLWLQERDPESGIRDFEAVDELAQNIGFQLQHDIAMPANNQLLVWRK